LFASQPSFWQDIEGTASVVLSGILSSLRVASVKPIAEHVFLFMGAGEAGTGIAELIALYISQQCSISMEQARKQCWLFDSKGLVVKGSQSNMAPHKIPFAHEHTPITTLLEAVKHLKPTALIGVSSTTGAFNRDVIEDICRLNARPIVFALSNPTEKAECIAKGA
jgi:malate dehydrogenase (oxaloacetate-decarboxylating)(NADP+)